MILRLEYKQGDKYGITLNSQRKMVTADELAQLIKNIPAPERNCQIKGDTIGMKAGYGSLPVKRLISKKDLSKNNVRDYVEIIEPVENYINAVREYPERDFKKYSLCAYFDSILRLEKIKVINLDRGIVKTKFGETTDDNLSSGIKSLLVLSWYIQKRKAITIDLSSCGSKHLGAAFEMIVKSGLAIKVILRHICVGDITTKILYKGRVMTSQEYLDLMLERGI